MEEYSTSQTSQHSAGVENYGGFCCAAKQYYLTNNALTETLEIIPRLITYRKHLRAKDSYEQFINLKNNGLYARHLSYSTDSPEDTSYKVYEIEEKYLEPGAQIQIKILINSKTSQNINRTRHFYVTAEHPNITFEIPIIVLTSVKEFNVPDLITFPPSIPKTTSYYEFAIFNPSNNSYSLIVKTLNPLVQVTLSSASIPKKDYVRILVALKVRTHKHTKDNIKVKAGNSNYLTIQWVHNPITSSLYTNVSHINFEELIFNRTSKKQLIICNESQHDFKYHVNFPTDHSSRQSDWETEDEILLPDKNLQTINAQDTFDTQANKHFGFDIQDDTIIANSSIRFTVQFQPISNEDTIFDDDKNPPFTLTTNLIFSIASELETVERTVTLTGLVNGPEVEFWPKKIEVTLFVGEENCYAITVRNIDKLVDAKVVYVGYADSALAKVTVEPPESKVLALCETAQFIVHLYMRIVGKFQMKLQFKIKNGKTFFVIIKGTSRQVRLKFFPDMIELGSVPVAIPQKRSVLLMNPLSVPVSVQCLPSNDGDEPPLVLNVGQSEDLLPVTMKDHVKEILTKDEEYSVDEPEFDLSGRASSLDSFHSFADDKTSYSTEFEDGVLWGISDLAHNVVSKMKILKVGEKVGAEEKVVEETMQILMRCEYFSDFTENQNYTLADWNALPTDPKEIYCGREIFYLSPNTGKHMTILIIPNKLGYHNRFLEVRCCPYMETGKYETWHTPDPGAVIESDLMTSKVWIEYNCRIPDVIWKSDISFDDHVVYAGQEYDFEMSFENTSNIGGFIFYDVVPDSADGVMTFRDDVWKFFINPYDTSYTVCCVVFRRYGSIRLPGLLKFVGQQRGIPFYLSAYVLPPKVRISPKVINRRQNVLDDTKIYIYIDNITPTITWLTVHMKTENFKYQTLNPHGAILGPEGQGTYVVLRTKYYDPEVYKNTLFINVRYGKMLEIPITFNIEGMPIYFEPNIKEGFDAGFVLTNTRSNFYDDIPNYSKDIRVINRGERPYRLLITKLRSGDRKCSVSTTHTRLNVNPKNIVLQPGCFDFLHITANACEPLNIYNEFRIQIIDMANPKRFMNILFIISAHFIQPELQWNRREICFDYYRTHQFKDHSQIEIVQLRNIASVLIKTIKLTVLGPFKIKGNFEDKYSKELECNLDGLQCKEFIIELNKKAIKDQFCTYLTCGRINCSANGEIQKSLPLRVRIFNPDLRIIQTDIVLFKKYSESDFNIEIENFGCLDAEYKWKKLIEETHYVDQFEDSHEFADELLSEVLRGIDFSDDDSDVDSLYERNMTLQFQKFRCRIQNLYDPINVMEIIDEIFDNLDLEHKRYLINFDEVESKDYAISERSSKACVNKTIDGILSMLKLDDSYDISEVSSDDCCKERTVYFYDKSGTLLQGEKAQCQIHLPPIRNGYALTATFQLDVVGGVSRTLNLTLVNLQNTVRLTKSSIYLGIQPWYELYKSRVRVLNVTQFNVKIRVEELPYITKRRRNRIADGYVNISGPKHFDMHPFASKRIKFEGITGFCDEFCRDIKVTANDSEELHLRLRGQGIMPMLTVADKMPHFEQSQNEIFNEYKLLQRIYHFEVFRSITEEDEELPIGEEEGGMETKAIASDYSILSDTTSNSSNKSKSLEHERRFYRILQTYVLVNNNAELPDGSLLLQLIETEKFLESLSSNEDMITALQLVYGDYVKTVKCHDEKMPLNLRHFTAQPLPFNLHGNVLNMGLLKLNEVRKFKIDLHFYGPGKLIAAARTVVKIHGMVVDFEVPKRTEDDREYLYYAAEQKAPDFFDKRYRNMYEREIDQHTDYKLKHAHSFDCDKNLQHQRQPRPLTAKELKSVHNYYNSLNKSIYVEHRHHFILCKIFTNSKKNFSGTQLSVVILIKPEAKFYEIGQVIEDYLYIDLHLGPTLPILLRGMIK